MPTKLKKENKAKAATPKTAPVKTEKPAAPKDDNPLSPACACGYLEKLIAELRADGAQPAINAAYHLEQALPNLRFHAQTLKG